MLCFRKPLINGWKHLILLLLACLGFFSPPPRFLSVCALCRTRTSPLATIWRRMFVGSWQRSVWREQKVIVYARKEGSSIKPGSFRCETVIHRLLGLKTSKIIWKISCNSNSCPFWLPFGHSIDPDPVLNYNLIILHHTLSQTFYLCWYFTFSTE